MTAQMRLEMLKSQLGTVKTGGRTPEQDLVVSRYVACLVKRIKPPKLLVEQLKKVPPEPEPGPAILKLIADVMVKNQA
jgi:hypothetical protein